MCLVPGNCADKALVVDRRPRRRCASRWTRRTPRCARRSPETPVVVTAYPDPIYRGQGRPRSGDRSTTSCGTARRWRCVPEERAFVAGVPREAQRDRRRPSPRAHHFYFLGEMKDSLKEAGLQLCDPANHGRPGLNFIGLRSVSGLAEQRFNPANWSHNSLHPNERGHQAMLETFERWVDGEPRAQPWTRRTSPTGDTAVDSAVDSAVDLGVPAALDGGSTTRSSRRCAAPSTRTRPAAAPAARTGRWRRRATPWWSRSRATQVVLRRGVLVALRAGLLRLATAPLVRPTPPVNLV